MACACAAETMEPPAVSETESKAPTPQFTLSEVNAESSKTQEPAAPSETAPAESEPQGTVSTEESDIELEPIQPVEPIQPIIPVKKETTLEKVLSFDIGENGLFSYHVSCSQDPNPEGNSSRPIYLEIPEVCAVDENGNLYIYHMTDGLPYIYCANSGEKFLVSEADNVFSFFAVGNRFFMSGNVPRDGFWEYDEDEFVKQYTSQEYTPWTRLYFDSQGNSYVQIPEAGIYTLEGKKKEIPSYPQYRIDSAGVQNVTYGNYQAARSLYDQLYGDRFVQTDGVEYTVYDLSENALYRFVIDSTFDRERNVSLGVLEEKYTFAPHHPHIVKIGDVTLEALQSNVITAWDGTMYLLSFYPDHAVLYRINPGYSDIACEEITVEEDAVASSSVLAVPIGCEAHTEDHSHAHVTKEEALARALAMCEDTYEWELLDGHAPQEEDLPDGVEIPTYIATANVGAQLKGIPYCYGGYYGLEEESRDSFADAATMLSNGIAKYITGNVCHDGRVSGTIGLDCSGFVSSVYDFYSKCSTLYLDTCGHEIAVPDNPTATQLNALLQPMDLIVAEDYHCMLYLGPSPSTGYIRVYDCTGGTGVALQRTNERQISITHLINKGYIYRRMTCIYGSDASKHWYKCELCSYTGAEAEHTWKYESTSSGHRQVCNVCGYATETESHELEVTGVAGAHFFDCSLCSFSSGPIPHAFGSSYTHTATQHTRTCSECGYSVTATHTFSGDYVNNGSTHGRSCVCGYTETIAHTLSYHHNVDTHWRECSVCDYATAPLVHVFVNGRCRVCNALQIGSGPANIIVIPPEEDELLPVPEDQKASV